LKFKSIFIIFDAIILFFLLLLTVMPIFTLGPSLAADFLASIWPLFLVFLLALIFLNVFYAVKYPLFRLLEMEDWPALIRYLEQKVIQDGHYSASLVRLLANTYLVMSDSTGVISFEAKVAIAKPALLESNALIFGAARILKGDYSGAAAFFRSRLNGGAKRDRDWLQWYYGFSLLLERHFEEAAGQFRALAGFSADAMVTGLASWFLFDVLAKNTDQGEAALKAAGEGRVRLRKDIKTRKDWEKEEAKLETEVHAVILKKYIDKAADWIYGSTGKGALI
jgi:hypothetical protein